MLILENITHDDLKKYMKEFYKYALEKLPKIDRDPKVVFKKDKKNAEDIFGKTGYYDPDEEKIALYITNRHPKDVIRSFAHELIHHEQKCRGDDEKLDLSKTLKNPSYALHDKGLREMEREAFERGNVIFRDWCDTQREKTGEEKMSESKRKSALEILSERVNNRIKQEAKQALTESKNKKQNLIKEEKIVVKNSEDEIHPYPQLLEKKERLFKERFTTHEDLIYQELLKRSIK